jgi:hypothetical protein
MTDQSPLFATLDAATVRAALLQLRERLDTLEINPLTESVSHSTRLLREDAVKMVDEVMVNLGLEQ